MRRNVVKIWHGDGFERRVQVSWRARVFFQFNVFTTSSLGGCIGLPHFGGHVRHGLVPCSRRGEHSHPIT
jgi:hypothetical protein